MGSGIAEAQVDTLSDAERSALLEVYEALRLTPGNGSLHVEGGNMYTWDYRGISVTYFLLEEQREVAVLRVDRLPALPANAAVRPSRGVVAARPLLRHLPGSSRRRPCLHGRIGG